MNKTIKERKFKTFRLVFLGKEQIKLHRELKNFCSEQSLKNDKDITMDETIKHFIRIGLYNSKNSQLNLFSDELETSKRKLKI